MGANGFLEHELISRKVKVGNEWQTKTFPIIAGRLRIIHDTNSHLSIATKIVKLEPDFVVVRATLECDKGKFTGTGTASAQRDARLADSLVELAETRSIARCLRFGGVGVEYAGFEEVSHIAGSDLEEQNGNKQPSSVFNGDNGNGKPEAKPTGNGNGKATGAQTRALYALTKKANYTQQDTESLLRPLNASTFQDLDRESASRLISYLQTEA